MYKQFRTLYNYIKMEKSKHNIYLTPDQQIIFHTLKTYRDQLGLKTVLRVAGGWVRDKIMNKESHDIDIALDDMKGQDFVKLIKAHSQTRQQKISGFGVTKFNPQLSKHLQTATARIHGQMIDFVNLRSQKYSQDSRIPVIDIGTPLQDALRRDFTINSLFYNINTEEIEDFTELGLSDIENKILRTPLQPYETFKDDPLRVLRCFRFKARFDFNIHEDIYKALERQDIHESLRTKVSKERIGIQLAGMLKAKHPLCAFDEVKKYGYWNIIFDIPKQADLKDPQLIQKIPLQSFEIFRKALISIQNHKWHSYQELIEANEGNKKPEQEKKTKQKKKKAIQYPEQELKVMVPLACLVVVYRHYKVHYSKTKFETLITHIVKNQLKYSTKVAKFVQGVCDSIIELEKILEDENLNRHKIIKWLRSSEEKWQLAIHILGVIVETQNRKVNTSPLKIRDIIINDKLTNTYLVQSHIDGNFLTKKGIKGPSVKTYLENSTIWRVLNPQSTREEFLQYFDKNLEFFSKQDAYN